MRSKYRKTLTSFLMGLLLANTGICVETGFKNDLYESVLGEVISGDCPDGNSSFFLATKRGIFKKDGEEWSRVTTPSGMRDIRGISVIKGKVYVISNGGLYLWGKRSGWEHLSDINGLKGISVYEKASSTANVLVWTACELFLLKDDLLENINPKLSSLEISRAGWDSGDIFLASGGKIFTSSTLGAKWDRTTFLKGYDISGEYEDIDDGEVYDPAILISYSALTGRSLILTPGRIFLQKDVASPLDLVDTTGLPASAVRHAVSWNGCVFAATDRRVFLCDVSGGGWRTVLEENPGGGSIVFLRLQRSEKGDLMLWIGAKRSIRTMDVTVLVKKYSETKLLENGTSVAGKDLTVKDVQKIAIEYAEVSPGKIRRWRERARWKAMLPKLTVNFSESIDENVELYKSATTSYSIIGPKEKDKDWGVGLNWDLSDLVWNDAQTSIDVRSKLMVQLRDEILEDVTRIYFERKRLVNEVKETEAKITDDGGPETRGVLSEKALRIEELTAYLDALTGGAFSGNGK